MATEQETARTGPDGQTVVQRYDIGKLAAIMRENNHRIEDRDANPALVDRHTAPAGHRDPGAPRTLGGVVPFRLGMISRKEPKFALFADEYTRTEATADLADRPGRSIEVLILDITLPPVQSDAVAIERARQQFGIDHTGPPRA